MDVKSRIDYRLLSLISRRRELVANLRPRRNVLPGGSSTYRSTHWHEAMKLPRPVYRPTGFQRPWSFCMTCVAMKFVDDDDDDTGLYLQHWWGRQPESGKQTLEMIVGYCLQLTWRTTEKQRVTVDLLNATPHADVGVNVDFQVTHRHWQNDAIGPDHACRPQQLMLSTGTEEQRRRRDSRGAVAILLMLS